ncbi:hypothetical protein CANARDRAFT_23352 [[Candida] arabinofermentans NRRL YB-2248]|uniref:Early meiotic induction protein 1 n=1 Tax=[Candida] arabinofermentans NRRL YB-2248 TaxID=983967 RepID=A0A1E4T0R4_9ASCO|nr:hypothetical protein CANARDRAFT_23352 [[Candida] arabinofermentans NRRL YB-2248]
MLFWSSQKDEKLEKLEKPPQAKDNTTTTQPQESNDDLRELGQFLSDAMTSNSASSPRESARDSQNMSLRDIAERRANSLSLENFPKEMSCLTAMDEMMECMSLGGQIRNYYRYGDFSMCDPQNEKMNFCFSNSLNAGEAKEKNIQEFYKNRLVEQLKRGSSEDIWEAKKF